MIPVNTPTLTFTLPNKQTVTIREQNGEDEDILSKVQDNKDGTATSKFLARIITEVDGVNVSLTHDHVDAWPIRNKYFIMLKSRIFSLGAELAFDYGFGEETEYPFIEDLNKYDWDFSKGFPPRSGEKGYNRLLPMGYETNAKQLTLKLHTGKEIRYDILTGTHEMGTMGLSFNDLTVNSKLIVRNFALKTGEGWSKIERFNMFSSREMSEIRTHILNNDPDYNLVTRVKHPSKEVSEELNFLSMADFFFPRV